jgi:hypothetical protein
LNLRPGETICGVIRLEALAPAAMGAATLRPIFSAHFEDSHETFWLTAVDAAFTPTSIDVSRFMVGANTLAGLRHPALVRIVVVDREVDFCVVGYEALPGAEPLPDVVARGNAHEHLPRVAVEVARALAFLHRKGLVHGSLTEGTVLLWEDVPLLWQYGLAALCVADEFGPRALAELGDRVAPEVGSGEPIGSASDVYAWGALIAHLAVGGGHDAVRRFRTQDISPIVPERLVALARRALQPAPHARPADGAKLLEALRDALTPRPDDRPPPWMVSSNAANVGALRELADKYLDEVARTESAAPVGIPEAVHVTGSGKLKIIEKRRDRGIVDPRLDDSGPLPRRSAPAPRAIAMGDGVAKRTVGVPRPDEKPTPRDGVPAIGGSDDGIEEVDAVAEEDEPVEELDDSAIEAIVPAGRRAARRTAARAEPKPQPTPAKARKKPRKPVNEADILDAALARASGEDDRRRGKGRKGKRKRDRGIAPVDAIDPSQYEPALPPPRKAGAAIDEPAPPPPRADPKPRVYVPPRLPGPHGPTPGRMALGLMGLTGVITLWGTASALASGSSLPGIGSVSSWSAAPPEPARTQPAATAPVDDAPLPAACPEGTTRLPAAPDAPLPMVCIEKYEQPGLLEIPHGGLGLDDAKATCTQQGRRLCTLDEWQLACAGIETRPYPYGTEPRVGRCRADERVDEPKTGPTGSKDNCVTPEGVHDLAGNVAEWVAEGKLAGGSVLTPTPGCRTVAKGAGKPADAGVRCCLDL